jgi:hypothetical protein
MITRAACALATVLLLSGCWNGGNHHISLGSVSIGQQLIDLKTALEVDAIDQQEYEATKQTLLALNSVCEATSEDG